jgi:sugar lactone lactonase YvrE
LSEARTSQPLLDSASASVLAEDLDHPEAVCWAPEDGAILAGGEAGQLYEIGLGDGSVHERANLDGGSLLGIALDADERTYVCDSSRGYVVRVERDGTRSAYGPRMSYPNYLAFDPAGALWVTDSGSWGGKLGRVFRIDPDGRGEATGFGLFSFSNGIAVSGREAYLVESERATLWRLDLVTEHAEPILELPRTVPDGVALDAEGGIWVSCFQPNRIYRLDPSGELAVVIDDWSGEEVLSPTNIAFAGADLRTLVLASLCGRTVKQLDVWVAGQALHYPQIGEGLGG